MWAWLIRDKFSKQSFLQLDRSGTFGNVKLPSCQTFNRERQSHLDHISRMRLCLWCCLMAYFVYEAPNSNRVRCSCTWSRINWQVPGRSPSPAATSKCSSCRLNSHCFMINNLFVSHPPMCVNYGKSIPVFRCHQAHRCAGSIFCRRLRIHITSRSKWTFKSFSTCSFKASSSTSCFFSSIFALHNSWEY